MPDIRTITQEFSVSGSLKDPQDMLTSTSNPDVDNYNPNANAEPLHETVLFLRKKIDELITEVNILKNS